MKLSYLFSTFLFVSQPAYCWLAHSDIQNTTTLNKKLTWLERRANSAMSSPAPVSLVQVAIDTTAIASNLSTFSTQTGTKFVQVATDTTALGTNLSTFSQATGSNFINVALSTSGAAYLASTQTFTGTNYFDGIIYAGYDSSPRIVIGKNGRVGIGITSPSYPLTVGSNYWSVDLNGTMYSSEVMAMDNSRNGYFVNISADTTTLGTNLSTFSSTTNSKFSDVAVSTNLLTTNLSTFSTQTGTKFSAVAVSTTGVAYLSSNQLFTGVNTFSSSASFQNSLFSVGGSTFVVTGGKVGIGTTGPRVPLDIVTPGVLSANVFQGVNTNTSGSGAAGAFSVLYEDDGAAMASGDRLGGFMLGGAKDNAHTLINTASVTAYADEVWTTTTTATSIYFEIMPPNATARSKKMIMRSSGNVGIGQTNPVELLHVQGNIYTSSSAVVASTLTVQGNAFSVGTSTFSVSNGQVYLPSYTLALINGLTPGAAGAQVYCSNCTNPVCISSGTGIGAYTIPTSNTTHCQ